MLWVADGWRDAKGEAEMRCGRAAAVGAAARWSIRCRGHGADVVTTRRPAMELTAVATTEAPP